jgi:hypothetical protein
VAFEGRSPCLDFVSLLSYSLQCKWGLSSAAERTVHIREVTGSNPVAPTIEHQVPSDCEDVVYLQGDD